MRRQSGHGLYADPRTNAITRCSDADASIWDRWQQGRFSLIRSESRASERSHMGPCNVAPRVDGAGCEYGAGFRLRTPHADAPASERG
jgi:hypothetical protein